MATSSLRTRLGKVESRSSPVSKNSTRPDLLRRPHKLGILKRLLKTYLCRIKGINSGYAPRWRSIVDHQEDLQGESRFQFTSMERTRVSSRNLNECSCTIWGAMALRRGSSNAREQHAWPPSRALLLSLWWRLHIPFKCQQWRN